MTDFTKTKMTFTLALLGTLFALHPFVEKIQEIGFYYGFDEYQVQLKIGYVYAVLAGLVALTVYFYSLILLSVRWAPTAERIGNYIYALTLMVLPLYGVFYLAHLLEVQMAHTEIRWMVRMAPWLAMGLGAFSLVLSQVLAIWLRGKLSAQDISARLSQLMERETQALNRAQEMFAGEHYDLAVIESWKALETRLQRALLAHDYHYLPSRVETLINTALRADIIDNVKRKQVHEVLDDWHVAIGTTPTTRESADKALKTTRVLLATTPVVDVRRHKRLEESSSKT